MPNDVQDTQVVGWEPAEVALDQPTRASRLKWVVVVNADLPAGVMVNAAVCLAACVGQSVPGVLGPGGPDGTDGWHPGLPWAGSTILAATVDQLTDVRARAATAPGVFVCDMPAIAQTNRVYADYLLELADTPAADLALHAVSLVGPRNRIDKLVRRLSLLS